MFNFDNPSQDLEMKEAKRNVLLGMVEYINQTKVLPVDLFGPIIDFLSANLFRDLPTEYEHDSIDADKTPLEPSWPHLQIVYEFFLRFIVSPSVEAKVCVYPFDCICIRC